MIIDVHSHLGDILDYDGGGLIDRTGVAKEKIFDIISVSEKGLMRTYGLGPITFRLTRYWVTRAERARNAAATLENMARSLDESGVDAAVCLPIEPYVGFDDLDAARKKDRRVLPFTSIDFSSTVDFRKKLTGDVRRGALGLKLHPIIQKIPLGDRRVMEALQCFEPLNKPVLTHAGISSYYLGSERTRNTPEYGGIRYIEEMVRTFPKIRFIIGHSGLFQSAEVMRRLRGCRNVWMDTSFQSPFIIRKLVKIFGEDRVMFASDWPYGERVPALRAVRVACRGNARLEEHILSVNARELLGL